MIPGITEIVSAIVKPILDKFVTDAKDRLEAENMVFKAMMSADATQVEVNKKEAEHPSVFVAGWRPFVGWVCGANLAYSVIVHSTLTWCIQLVSQISGYELPPLPPPDMTQTIESLAGLLGLGGLRTYEKFKGVARMK